MVAAAWWAILREETVAGTSVCCRVAEPGGLEPGPAQSLPLAGCGHVGGIYSGILNQVFWLQSTLKLEDKEVEASEAEENSKKKKKLPNKSVRNREQQPEIKSVIAFLRKIQMKLL